MDKNESFQEYLLSALGISSKDVDGFSASTEDNSTLEVNFHIDTKDGDATDTSDVDVNTDTDTEPSKSEQDSTKSVIEATAEANKAEDELSQLQEAQDSLESIGLIISEHATNGSLSPATANYYRIALESLVDTNLLDHVGIPSMESFGNNKLIATSNMLRSHDQILSSIKKISLESLEEYSDKVEQEASSVKELNLNLLKRAKGLLQVAESSSGEHAETKEIDVNGKHEVQLDYITKLNFDDDESFKQLVDEMLDFCDNVKPISVSNGVMKKDVFDTSVLDNGEFKTFGAVITYKDDIWKFDKLTTEEPSTKVVTLTAGTSKDILNRVISTLQSQSDTLSINVERLTKAGKSFEDQSDERKFQGILSTLRSLNTHRTNVITQILNYVNLSLTNREIN